MGDSGVGYRIPDAPFEFQYSYTETPKVRPLALREEGFSPFGPGTMPRPWTGRAPLSPSKKKLPEFDSFKLPPPHKKGVKPVQAPGPFLAGMGPKYVQSREEVMGDELTEVEIKDLVQGCLRTRRQLNMGRDGLTHNMLENIHAHWKRRRVCKIKCKGVCTVDMDNVCQQLEEKTGGKIISRQGGVLFLFRGRNYNYKTRPRFPLMLWKPITPVYPRLVKQVPKGLTIEEVKELRKRGHKLPPICRLGKNGVYSDLVKHVREAFEECELARINCQGMNGSDYRKIGAKLKDLVPCVLISFAYEHILMWRGREWKSMFPTSESGSMGAKGLETDSQIADPPSFADSSSFGDGVTSDVDACPDALSLIMSTSGNEYSEGNMDLPDFANENETFDSSSILGVDKPSSPGSVQSGLLGSFNSLVFQEQENSFSNSNVDQSSISDSDDVVSEVIEDVAHASDGDECFSVVDIGNHFTSDDESSALSDSLKRTIDPAVADMNGPSSIPDRMTGIDEHSSEAISCHSHSLVLLSESHGAAVQDKVRALTEGTEDPVSLSVSVSTCTEGIALLLKEAIDNGNAVILDDTSLDANAIYSAAVSLAKDAKPGPRFQHRPQQASKQKQKNQEDGNSEEVVSRSTSGSEKKIQKRNSRTQKLKDFKGVYSDTLPRGSLGIDELAKLLA
ncbi:hypothetical protein Sjap_011583 [Stephania japonica]|uniref:CRM domain-containing protein n=1 Tax=Stephania japonica TaxID=461633 RepID=A0AAP0P873_9MAGN